MISEICDMFGCTPREAVQQDMQLVREIAEYRNAKSGLAMLRQKNGSQELANHPQIVALLTEMHRAQDEANSQEPVDLGLALRELNRIHGHQQARGA